jgi:hypothetical protein
MPWQTHPWGVLLISVSLNPIKLAIKVNHYRGCIGSSGLQGSELESAFTVVSISLTYPPKTEIKIQVQQQLSHNQRMVAGTAFSQAPRTVLPTVLWARGRRLCLPLPALSTPPTHMGLPSYCSAYCWVLMVTAYRIFLIPNWERPSMNACPVDSSLEDFFDLYWRGWNHRARDFYY